MGRENAKNRPIKNISRKKREIRDIKSILRKNQKKRNKKIKNIFTKKASSDDFFNSLTVVNKLLYNLNTKGKKGEKNMGNWQCPIEYIDEDIREVVRILYENGMKPYMSCSGSYKDHKQKSVIVQSACVEMLDSELTREFMAILINDKRFKCSISKENAREFYDNHLPLGFRFIVSFENICGDVSKDLQSILEDAVKGMKSNIEDRKKIDAVCELINTFDVSKGNSIAFSFNDEMVNPVKAEGYNYSITIRDQKDLGNFKSDFGKSLDGFFQDQYESRFFGSDFVTMLIFLKKVGTEYSEIPMLKPGQKPRCIVDGSRIDKFMSSHTEKTELAKMELEGKQNQSLFEDSPEINFEDLLGFFQGEDNDDGMR